MTAFINFENLVLTGTVYGVQYTAAAGTVASATATGPFALYNPAASGRNLILLQVNAPFSFTTVNAAAPLVVGLQFVANQTPTTTTPGNTPQNALIGCVTPAVAKTYTAGTIAGAPTTMGYGLQGADLNLVLSDVQQPPAYVNGFVVIAPNSGVSIVVSSVTSVPTLIPTILWAEVLLDFSA